MHAVHKLLVALLLASASALATPNFNAAESRKIALGAEATSSAISADGQFLAFGFAGSNEVKVFTRLGGNWLEEVPHDATLETPSGDFGATVKFGGDYGNYLFVGAPTSNSSAGSIYVFAPDLEGTYQQKQAIVGFVEAETSVGDELGSTFAVSGDASTLLASRPVGKGGFYYYKLDTQDLEYDLQYIDDDTVLYTTSDSSTLTGTAIATSYDGEVAAYSAATWNSNQGKVWIFQRNNDGVFEEADDPLTVADSVLFGSELAFSDSGEVLAVAARRQNDDIAVYVFKRTDGVYDITQSITTAAETGDTQGVVSIGLNSNGKLLVIGDKGYNDNAGLVEAQAREDTDADFAVYPGIDLKGSGSNTKQGAKVNLASDGRTLMYTDDPASNAWIFEVEVVTEAPGGDIPTEPPSPGAASTMHTGLSAFLVMFMGLLAAVVF